jgi:hypothetical protein
MLSAMLGFAALVVDLANVTQVRRQAQNTADAAALAGAQDLPDAPSVVSTVKAYAFSNLSIPATAWQGCVDGAALSVHPDGANANTCISIDAAYTRVRVRLPTQPVETFFGGVFGVDSLDVRAIATAEAQLRADGRIIPAAVTASMGTGHLCIENSGNNSACSSSSSGNFGSLDAPRLNIYQPSANEDPSSLATNYAMSLDHDVRIYASGLKVCDGELRTPCAVSNASTVNTANHLNVYTGNAVPPVTEGFVKGFTINTDDQGQVSFCGRLQRPDTTPANVSEPAPGGCTQPGTPTITVLGESLNGRHAYYWLKPWARALFYPEVPNTTRPVGDASYANGDARFACFAAGYRYDQATGVETVPACAGITLPGGQAHWWGMFDKDLSTDPRFGVIPIVSSWSNGGSQALPIVGFWASFTYNLYTSSQKLQALDAWVFDPALIATASGTPGVQFGYQTDPVIRLVE